jgi:PAS domain-containing protein
LKDHEKDSDHKQNIGVADGKPEPVDFAAIFERTPGNYLILDPHLKIVAVNQAYARATLTKAPEIIGRALFEVFPDNPADSNADGISNLRASLLKVLKTRAPDKMAIQKYDIPIPAGQGAGFEERYWSPVNTPVLGADGYVRWIIHCVEDVTEMMKMRADRKQRQDFAREQALIVGELREARRELVRIRDENTKLRAAQK